MNSRVDLIHCVMTGGCSDIHCGSIHRLTMSGFNSPLLASTFTHRNTGKWWRKRFCSQNLAVVTHCITLPPSLCFIHSPPPSHSLPLPPPCHRYVQAVVPGKPLGWNTECECRETHSYNRANVWILKSLALSLFAHVTSGVTYGNFSTISVTNESVVFVFFPLYTKGFGHFCATSLRDWIFRGICGLQT